MENFELVHESGNLYVLIDVDGVTYRKNVTEYFSEHTALDDWLDFRLGIK